jgi:flagellar motor switch protein FliG
MTSMTTNLRKAAILMRSVDADTAATLLGQLAPEEARAIRAAIQSLGPIDAEEQADVAAEFRRVGPLIAEDPRRGVELNLSAAAEIGVAMHAERPSAAKPFEFLERARVESLVPYLAREHSQTVAVVLSYLAPRRAAEVLAALPARLQAATIERLSSLGETDPASIEVLERELAEWVARQQATRSRGGHRSDAAAAILAAADESVRSSILANLMQANRELAEQLAPPMHKPKSKLNAAQIGDGVAAARENHQPIRSAFGSSPVHGGESAPSRQVVEARMPTPRIAFGDLARLDQATLAQLLRTVDANVWVLALAAAEEVFVERIADLMPRPTAKAFRKRLRQLGPTRLSDIEAAQQEVVAAAVQILRQRAPSYAASTAPAR